MEILCMKVWIYRCLSNPKLGQGKFSTFLQVPKDNMRFCELSTGFRFPGAGGTATGKVVGGRGPEDTIKKRNGWVKFVPCVIFRNGEAQRIILYTHNIYLANLRFCDGRPPFDRWENHQLMIICIYLCRNYRFLRYGSSKSGGLFICQDNFVPRRNQSQLRVAHDRILWHKEVDKLTAGFCSVPPTPRGHAGAWVAQSSESKMESSTFSTEREIPVDQIQHDVFRKTLSQPLIRKSFTTRHGKLNS